MHGDHVGQNTRLVNGRWVPTFPNAKYLFSQVEWQYWSDAANRRQYNEDGYFEDSIQPIIDAGLVQLIYEDWVVDERCCCFSYRAYAGTSLRADPAR